MNLRLYSIALLMCALPVTVTAGASAISLNKGDFVSAERLSPDGETIVSVKLSKSGKAKIKKLNKDSVNKVVRVEVAGVSSDFKLREPISGEGLEMGPYAADVARRIEAEINRK